MADVKRLLDEATPLPWRYTDDAIRVGDGKYPVVAGLIGLTHIVPMPTDAALIVHAVNSLPDYEAAVDALHRLIAAADIRDYDDMVEARNEGAAIIDRLRGDR